VAKKIERGDLRWDSEGHTGELAVELRNDLTDSLGGTGGRWDDVGGGRSASSPVLVRRSIDGLLGGTKEPQVEH
jgi:hypothetical protein